MKYLRLFYKLFYIEIVYDIYSFKFKYYIQLWVFVEHRLSSGQTLGVKAQRFRGHTSPHRNVKVVIATGLTSYHSEQSSQARQRRWYYIRGRVGRRLLDRKSTRLNSSHITRSRMPSSA
eukprot:TRINITY_DN15447_c0_g1_i4.p3 TRINITY_DN15447_c0_g1~~TRINITY_DN15447_c0_g1_i4.p3  ORF type:complete len:119 (+),score=4.35 TRINITY_DN15447_c0_g1_i4:1107-1463(+)